MKRIFLLLALALCLPAAAQLSKEEEDLMRAYGATDEYMEMQRKMDEIVRQGEKSRQDDKNARTIMLVLSLAVAVVPLWATCKNIIQHPELRTGKGVASAIAVSLLGGAILFGFNYGWMYLRWKAGDALNFPLAVLITAGIAVGAFYLLNKKDKKDEKDS